MFLPDTPSVGVPRAREPPTRASVPPQDGRRAPDKWVKHVLEVYPELSGELERGVRREPLLMHYIACYALENLRRAR